MNDKPSSTRVEGRRVKVSKKDFTSVFTNRSLSFKEKYLQDFWIVKKPAGWCIEQKRKPLLHFILLTVASILLIIGSLFSLLTGGTSGLRDFWDEVGMIDWFRNIVRVDYLPADHETTERIIELSFW